MKKVLVLAAGVLFAGACLFAEEAAIAKANAFQVEIKVGTGVKDRQVVGESERFGADTVELVGWSLIKGATEPTEVTHVWSVDGKVVETIPLPIKSSKFRTWSREKPKGRRGMWRLDVKDINGRVLASKSFEVY